ncbi:cytosine/adenosine deaminase-related metal-dependent hydrolase [Microbacterium testaceum]|nr:cytosine/adenosine deaminase-related metal-dependent hydrolase [Microbacterium testaceum]
MRLATTAAAWAVGREVHDLEVGARADIVLMDAENPMDALVRLPERALVVGGGRVLHVA